MRKLTAILACLCLLISAGCAYAAVNSRQEDSAYAVYFLEADLGAVPGGDALRAEEVYLNPADSSETQKLAEALLTRLAAGPEDETLQSTLPAGTNLLSVTLDGSRAWVDLSTPYSTLSGVALTMADYAITLTLTQLQEISSVSITVQGQELAYRSKQVFSAKDVLLSSTEDVVGTVSATLYFLNGNGVLTPKERVLELYEGDTQVSAVVKALEDGPEDREMASALPEGFQVKSVWLEEDICYINFSSAGLQEVADPVALQMAVQVLDRSLRSLDAVSEVRFLIDGELAAYYDTVPLS